LQFDEKWSFVGKKQDNCDPAANPGDERRGEHWDHVAMDPEHRLVLCVVPGKRTAENCRAVVADACRRTGGRLGRLPRLITTDEYPSYQPAIADVYGRRVVPLAALPRRGGRPRGPRKVVPAGLNYAVVHKHRDAAGRVTRVSRRVVFGTAASVAAALKRSRASRAVNTAFVERQNGTDRHRNARKARDTYRFSKDDAVHASMTYFTMYGYNFCHAVRTLAPKGPDGRRPPRTPAMAAGLADHVWSVREWVTRPAVQSG
jgi:IS1 family transposase